MNKKIQKLQDRRKSELLFLLLFFALTTASIVLGILCLDGVQSLFFKRHFLLLSILYALLMCLLLGICIWFTLAAKKVGKKVLLSIYVLLLFFLGVCLILQKTGFFSVVNTPERLQEYLERTGAWMPIIYTLLQFLQVILLPIPSVVSTLVGVALFGAFWAMIYSLIGILLGSITAFAIGRRFGNKAVAWMVGEEALKKWQRKLKGKDNLFLTAAFVLPLFPDDILCFIAGLSTMTTRYFLIVIFLARAIGIAATCYSIDFIPFNTWWGITLWIVFLTIVVISFIFIYKNMDKIQTRLKQTCRKKKDKSDKS